MNATSLKIQFDVRLTRKEVIKEVSRLIGEGYKRGFTLSLLEKKKRKQRERGK